MDKTSRTIRRRYSRIAPLYDLMEAPMEQGVSGWRRQIMEEVRGRVLEVGVGTGKNLPHYPPERQVVGIDFSRQMLRRTREKVPEAEEGVRVDLIEMDAEALAFPDRTFDTVLTSCVFCSVPDADAGLEEIHRVLRPGGRLVMLEHVRSEKPLLGPLMDLLNPIPVTIYGANINRRTVERVEEAGFELLEVTDLWLDIFKKILAVRPD